MEKNCSNCRFGSACPNRDVCVVNASFGSISAPFHWKEMTEAQKLERAMSEIKNDKKLIGDISGEYNYIDTDMASRIAESKRRAKEMDVLNSFENDTVTKMVKEHVDKEVLHMMNNSIAKSTINRIFGIKKEDKNMNIKLYMDKGFIGGVVTRPQDLIKNVIFSGPCTIVQWLDGDKTIVRCENEDFDKEKGLAMAIVKKFFGTNKNKTDYYDIFKKWIQEEKVESNNHYYYSVKTYAKKFGMSETKVRNMCRDGKLNAKKQDGAWLIRHGDLISGNDNIESRR